MSRETVEKLYFHSNGLPGKVNLKGNIRELLRFFEENTSDSISFFDSSVLTGPSFSYTSDDPRGIKKLDLRSIEHAVYGKALDNEEIMNKLILYFEKINALMKRENIRLTPGVKHEIQNNISQDIQLLNYHKSNNFFATRLVNLLAAYHDSIISSRTYDPRYKVAGNKFIGIIRQKIKPGLGRADLEGIASVFELHYQKANAALVTADRRQKETFERHAKERHLSFDIKSWWLGPRKNDIIKNLVGP